MRGRVLDFERKQSGEDLLIIEKVMINLLRTHFCKQTCGICPRNGAKVKAKTEATIRPKLMNRFQCKIHPDFLKSKQ